MLIAVCDRLKGLPEANTTFRERTAVQQCITHLIRNSFHEAGRQHRDGIVNALKPVYTAPSGQAEKERFNEFKAERGQQYSAIVRLWESSWAEFLPFLGYDLENPAGDLLDERDRAGRGPLPARGEGARVFPQRGPGAEMLLPGHEIA